MEQKSKKLEEILDLDDDLFCKTDIDFISDKIDENFPILLADDTYLEIDKELFELNSKLIRLLTEDELKLFEKYLDISLDASSYQNCLAYYLGIKIGINMKKFK